MGKTVGSEWCRCATCMKFQHVYAFSFSPGRYQSYIDGKCDLCRKFKRRDKLTKLCGFVPAVIKEFLEIDTVCFTCRNMIVFQFHHKYNGCWDKSHSAVIQIALLDVIGVALKHTIGNTMPLPWFRQESLI